MVEERGVSKRNAKACPCESCKKGRGASHKITPKEVHSYTSMPDEGWRPYMTLAEQRAVTAGAPKPWYMGVELETQLPAVNYGAIPGLEMIPPEPRGVTYYDATYQAWSDEYNRITRANRLTTDRWINSHPTVYGEEVVSMARPRSFWHAKHDGSVTGPEFASKPASLAWWYSRRAQFEFMFMTALHSGVRSHTGDKCGLHVNISMTAFEDAAHLARFAKLINLNKSWSRKMSQRTEASLHWGVIGGYGFRDEYQIERWAENTIRYGNGECDRYNALNTPGMGRIEFRLPRGTLRIDRFYKNLEWTHAMVEYTRAYGDYSAASFMRWVMSGTNYPALQAFLTEKFGVGIVEVPFDMEVAAAATGRMAARANYDVLAEYVAPAPDTLRLRGRGPSAMCECGDGCYADDCGACDDDFGDDDDNSFVECSCGDGCQVGNCGNCEDEAEREAEENRLEQERLLDNMSALPSWVAPTPPFPAYTIRRPGDVFDDVDAPTDGSFVPIIPTTGSWQLPSCSCDLCVATRNNIAAIAAESETA